MRQSHDRPSVNPFTLHLQSFSALHVFHDQKLICATELREYIRKAYHCIRAMIDKASIFDAIESSEQKTGWKVCVGILFLESLAVKGPV